MSARRDIPPALLRLQSEASDPDVSAWVAANAGSGKTHVLAQRVVRLLLDGVDPSKILCITFTKAAAANMANRVFSDLSRWTALDDAALDAAIRTVSNRRPDAALRARARSLFAVALETPGGLKVQTIHAFCTRLLHQFPFEANVAAGFTVLDDAAEAQLLDRISMGVMLEAAANPEGSFGRALSVAIAAASDQTVKDVLAEAIRKRAQVSAWTKDGVAAAIEELCGIVGLRADDTLAQVDKETVEGPLLPRSGWLAAASGLDGGSSNDREQAKRLRAAAALEDEEAAELYRAVFITTSDRKPRKNVITAKLALQEPALAQALSAEQARVCALYERRKSVLCRDRTAALLVLADAVIARYREEKDRRGLLDYDDLIDRTVVLLGNVDSAWVHYKLDRGIDHVLIDEAQDTSPRQWQIIRKLTEEFFAGHGARFVKRTLFAVGDEKQSIFSFQGADPKSFDAMFREFNGLAQAAKHELRSVKLAYSFRSGEIVLGAVDQVFHDRTIFASITSDTDRMEPHLALPNAAPGLVEVWDTVKPDPREAAEAWDAPFDTRTETNPQAKLARKIARHVAALRRGGARAGDVLILVRQRGSLFEGIIRALKDAGVAVAGADRLILTEHIAVMDLMALGDALLLPQDDLALASVLKSPLLGLDDDDLFALAHDRTGSLRTALRAKAGERPQFAAANDALDRLAERARRETPFAFYARVLGAEGGRRKILARLGAEADDALDEFLNLALAYESREIPSLQGFLAWLRTAQAEVKRDMEITRDEVRVMTVHGAKGLEARIVILADTTSPPAGPAQRQPKLLPVAPARAVPDTPDRLVWGIVKAGETDLTRAARARVSGEAEDEYRRLLYVAMTRAAERLIVCGADGQKTRPTNCWYNLVRGALEPIARSEAADDGDGNVLRYRKTEDNAREFGLLPPVPTRALPERPAWLDRLAPIERPARIMVSPSRVHDAAMPQRRAAVRDGLTPLQRGTVVHRLLQSLPGIAPAGRADAAQRYLARAARDAAASHEALIAEVLAVLDAPAFAAAFAPGSRAEVPLVGRIDRPGKPSLAVSGQVDRLAVTDSEILIADYKTNRPAPRTLDSVPPGYVAQLALYRALLARLYPDRPVRAALIWTDVPDLMEIPAAALDAALAAVTSA